MFMLFGFMKLVIVMGGVAFFTLLERKVLSYSQNRKGPKKVSFLGFFQPLGDAGKLLLKSFGGLMEVSLIEFFLFPLVSLLIMFSFWMIISPFHSFYKFNLGIVLIFVLLSLGVFPMLGSGWVSNSKYSVLGALRGAAQSVSYEVVLMFVMIWVLLFLKEKGFIFNNFIYLGVVFWLVFFIWFMVMICETNRAPFDFAEGESELVSGFNVEYGSFPFALLFLAEYGMILFLSILSGVYFFSFGLGLIGGWLVAMGFLWVRSSFPRSRYDLLMSLCWGVFLPLTFVLFFWLNLL